MEKRWGRFGTRGAIPARRNLRVAPVSSRQYGMNRDVNRTSLAETLVSAKLRQNQRLERVDRAVDRQSLGKLGPSDGSGVGPQVGPSLFVRLGFKGTQTPPPLQGTWSLGVLPA